MAWMIHLPVQPLCILPHVVCSGQPDSCWGPLPGPHKYKSFEEILSKKKKNHSSNCFKLSDKLLSHKMESVLNWFKVNPYVSPWVLGMAWTSITLCFKGKFFQRAQIAYPCHPTTILSPTGLHICPKLGAEETRQDRSGLLPARHPTPSSSQSRSWASCKQLYKS